MSVTDGWCTPEWLTEMLPEVDLDPCSNANSTVKARLKLEVGGVENPWPTEGALPTAWWNPPYSNPMPWCDRAIEFTARGGESLGLLKLDPTTRWFELLATWRAEFFPLRKRVKHAPGPGLTSEGCVANFPQVLVHLGRRIRFAPVLFKLTEEGHAWGQIWGSRGVIR